MTQQVTIEGKLDDWDDEDNVNAQKTMTSFLKSLETITGYHLTIVEDGGWIRGTYDVPEDLVLEFETVTQETMWNVLA